MLRVRPLARRADVGAAWPARTTRLLAVGLLLGGCGQAPTDGAPAVPFVAVLDEVVEAPPPTPAAAVAAPAVTTVVPAAPAADPVWLVIPAIDVDTPTIHLDLRADEAEVPERFDVAGWYRQTVEPGTVGPAVMVGHVGSRQGPGVFSRLDELEPGDEILVTDADGTVRTFVVDRGALVDKYDRPPDVLGRGEERPELRLITCGGEFDPATRHHLGNYVIWAHEA